MINREITYERNISRSYMKIPACPESSFDEDVMLKKQISGILNVEKCYINGVGQYWYNITGKQALDSYTKMKNISIHFVEKLLLNICSQMEKLEWNLMSMNCLVLDPELIFIANGSEEIYFTLYPENKGEAETELAKLMEYLLTRLDHKDTEAVKTAYAIYELTLREGYSLSDIREAVEKNRENKENKENKEKPKVSFEKERKEQVVKLPQRQEKQRKLKCWKVEDYGARLQELWEQTKKKLNRKFKKEAPFMVYPEMQEISMEESKAAPVRPEIHPTVCLVSKDGKVRGVLMHEGAGEYPDYELSERNCEIGNNSKADLYIKKETVSCLHAGIEYRDGHYYIEDFNSTNGTYINNVAVNYKQKQKLVPGDEIRFADVRYRFL